MTHRVARVVTRLNIGGPSIQAITLTRELAARGFSTLLVHGRLGASEGDMTTLLPVTDLRTQAVPALVRPLAPLNDLKALWQLYRTFCRWRPEIIHTHMAKAGTLGRLAGLLYNRTSGRTQPARLVHTYHGHVFQGYFGSLSSRFFMSIERWLGRHTDAVVAISGQVRKDVLQTYSISDPARTHLIPLGFDLERFFAITAADRVHARKALDIPPGAVTITTVGRLTAIKQQTLFLQMAAEVARQNPAALFLIVGDGELRDELQAEATAAGIADRVRFLGWRGDLETVYGASDLFVLTSRNEGTPVALIEAMAAGVPAVSTDVGGVSDVLAGAFPSALVPFGDVPALVTAVNSMVNSQVERASVGALARTIVGDRFDLTRLVADIGQLYSTLLHPSGVRALEGRSERADPVTLSERP
jgi:glycosyltransferase involved in cell wall biosynthesis